MIRGAIFDMDGLMFDSERLVYEIWQEMMDENGFNYDLEVFKKTIGLRTDKAEQYYCDLYGSSFDYKPFKQKSRKTFIARVTNDGVPIKKGLFEILDYLKANSIKMAVATSTSAQTALNIIKMAGVYDYFDAFVCGDDVKNGKPHPEVFLTASQRLGIPPKDCVAFEDSINGIKSAYAANMMTVMVPDFLEPTDEIRPMLSFLCKDLTQAVQFLQSQNNI